MKWSLDCRSSQSGMKSLKSWPCPKCAISPRGLSLNTQLGHDATGLSPDRDFAVETLFKDDTQQIIAEALQKNESARSTQLNILIWYKICILLNNLDWIARKSKPYLFKIWGWWDLKYHFDSNAMFNFKMVIYGMNFECLMMITKMCDRETRN